MFKRLILLAAMLLSPVASAQDYGNPYAYLTNSKGGVLVLTDKEDRVKCPPKARLVVAVDSREVTEPTLGCWVQMTNEDTGRVEVLIIWHPSHSIQWIPLDRFKAFESSCPQTLSL